MMLPKETLYIVELAEANSRISALVSRRDQ